MASPRKTFPEHDSLMDSLFGTPPFRRILAIINTANLGVKQDLMGYFQTRIANRLGTDRRFGKVDVEKP